MERRLEYEKGPPTDDAEATDEERTEPESEQPEATDQKAIGVRALPWRVGLLFGLGAFLVNYAVTLQTVVATNGFLGQAENGPGTWTSAGFVLLSNHGVAIRGEAESLPLEAALTLSSTGSVVHFVPLLTLTAAGYGLVSYLNLETVRNAAGGALTVVPSYLGAVVALAWLTRFTYEPPEGGGGMNAPEEPMTFAASLPETVLLAGVLFPATLAVIGGLLAIWPRPLDRLLGSRPQTDGSTRDGPTSQD